VGPPGDAPDALVLGAGGILGEAWMSALLAGLADARLFDPRSCGHFLGTSAGSIVAASLAAGYDPRERLGELPEQPQVGPDEGAGGSLPLRLAASLGAAVSGPLAPAVLRSAAPGGRLLRRAALRRVPPGRRSLNGLVRVIAESGAKWDDGLWIATVEVESGSRVLFGGRGEDRVPVADAVAASCAIPGVFRPIMAGGRTYLDGGVWSLTNLDALPAAAGERILCLNPTGSARPRPRDPLGAIGPWSRSMAALEASVQRRRGARVELISPDSASAAAMGPNLMEARRRDQVLAAGLAQGRRGGGGPSR